MKVLLERFPGFSERWQAHLEYWAGEEAGLCNDVSEFGRYIRDLVACGETQALPAIFNLLEQLLVEGDSDVQDAVATCCLENLLNYFSAGAIPAESLVHLVGPQSRAYCQAWDEFTGVQTPGL